MNHFILTYSEKRARSSQLRQTKTDFLLMHHLHFDDIQVNSNLFQSTIQKHQKPWTWQTNLSLLHLFECQRNYLASVQRLPKRVNLSVVFTCTAAAKPHCFIEPSFEVHKQAIHRCVAHSKPHPMHLCFYKPFVKEAARAALTLRKNNLQTVVADQPEILRP